MDLILNSGIQKPEYTQVQLHTRVVVCACIHTHVHAHTHEDITKCCKSMERKCTEISHYWNMYRFYILKQKVLYPNSVFYLIKLFTTQTQINNLVTIIHLKLRLFS